MISTATRLPRQEASGAAGSLLVYHDSEAERYLASPDVQESWRALWDRCPWATALQRPEYVSTWYRCYKSRYRPLVVVCEGTDGGLHGLLTLAIDSQSGVLTFAGANQAEYHVWLAPTGPQTFISEALTELSHLGFSSLAFTYLPRDTPLNWLGGGWCDQAQLMVVRKPVLDIGNGEAIRTTIRKKRHKSRLARTEAFEFVELKTPEELDQDYNDIIAFTDFRQGAIHNICPFRDDPCKRMFYRELLRQPELLHITVMRTEGKAIAGHIGLRSRQELIVGTICHSPFVAQHSPGIFHLLRLALLLQQQGFLALDLTPGGGAYKDRLATRYEEIHTLVVYFDAKQFSLQRTKARMRTYFRRAAANLPGKTDSLKQYRMLASEAISNPAGAARAAGLKVRTRFWSTSETRFYRIAAGSLTSAAGDQSFDRDSIADLLLYESDRQTPSRQRVLSRAMAAIEAGAHLFTCVQDGRLSHYGWLLPRPERSLTADLHGEFDYPSKSALLFDLCSHPASDATRLHASCLRRMIAEASADPDVQFVYVRVPAEDRVLQRVVEKTGFEYRGSVLRKVRLNKTELIYRQSPGTPDEISGGEKAC